MPKAAKKKSTKKPAKKPAKKQGKRPKAVRAKSKKAPDILSQFEMLLERILKKFTSAHPIDGMRRFIRFVEDKTRDERGQGTGYHTLNGLEDDEQFLRTDEHAPFEGGPYRFVPEDPYREANRTLRFLQDF